jgi:putative flavoprotein involved in K+ transport
MFETDFEVVVIGGGQAGLTMGHFLGQERRRFVILERADSVAPAWRERWDSLTLFTPRRYSALPGLPIPGDPDGHSTRDEVVAYLERYAETFELPIELNSEVRRLFREGDHFVLELDGRTVTSDQVIVATGPFQTPFVPKLAAQFDPGLWQVHSTGYRRPNDVPEGTVLVVGGGNTGFQIAKELSATHKVVLSIGSKQKPLPQRIAGRDIFWWLTKTHLLSKTVESRLGSKFKGRDTLIGSSPRELTRKYKVELKGRASDGVARIVRFEDGTTLEVDSLIWATGYRPFYSWIDLPILDANGRLQHRRGVTEVPGLFFLGLTWQWTRGSALIGFVKDDAAFLAERIAALPEAETHPRPNAGPKQPALRPKHPRRASEMHDHHARGHSHSGTADFPTTIEGLTEAERPEVVELSDGDDFELRIAPVTKEIGGNKVRMLAYNGSIPGPTMKVRQGSEVLVRAVNEGDLEATVHWHGLRLDNEYDGTHQTQAPIPVGGSFTYRLRFPDEGLYWYHPHIRQDYGQEMGLYGNILVEPSEPEYWPPAHRDVFLTLDDILLDDEGRVAPFSPHETDYVAMGRFGTTFLIAGEPELTMRAKQGEVVRFYLTDTANTRVFKIGVAGARMKLVGGDSGHHEQEEMVEDVILALRAGRRRCALRSARASDAGAPYARAHQCPRCHHRRKGTRRAPARH